MSDRTDRTETATFAAGCFWGVEAEFRGVDGVQSTRVGYTGGHSPSPGYKQVCRGKTGHAEAVEVTFDPERVSYEQLLDLFWSTHNPTTLNRQGFDFGSQYRSAIFTHGEEQGRAARASLEREQENRRRQIVTQVEPAGDFWPAEDYHQQYLEKRGQASCAVSVA
jgi:peptide-methionine (S)-S-oxide reductase